MLSSKARKISEKNEEKTDIIFYYISRISFSIEKAVVNRKIQRAARRGKNEIAVSRSISDELIEYLEEQEYEVILNSDFIVIFGEVYDPIYIKW